MYYFHFLFMVRHGEHQIPAPKSAPTTIFCCFKMILYNLFYFHIAVQLLGRPVGHPELRLTLVQLGNRTLT